jgi:hypothetical protein
MSVCVSGFLDAVNSMLQTGMSPALFADDEKGQICGSIQNAAKDAGFDVTRSVLSFIIIQCPESFIDGIFSILEECRLLGCYAVWLM